MAKSRKKSTRIAGAEGDQFVLSPRHQKLDFLGWINKDTGEHINLAGKDFPTMTTETSRSPSKEILYRAATQEDLRAFWELGAMKVGDEWISNQGAVIKIDGGGDTPE